jgi:OOP family OmpA-OmpF porin
MRQWPSIVLSALMFCAASAPSFAQSCPVVEGFGDIEGLPVYKDACLLGAKDAGFSSYKLPIGPVKGRALGDALPLEGTLQRRLYAAPEGASAFDLFSNYRNALTEAGYETLFQCIDRDCGSNNGLLGKIVIYPSDRVLRNLGRDSEFGLHIDKDEHYLAAKSADGTRHIAVYVAQNKKNSLSKYAAGRAAVHIDVISAAALQAKMVDAAAMAKGITDDGRIALDNVYFDFGTAILSPEAAPAIAEMVKLMTENPALKVYIVGHTDWIGDPAANQTLSNARAQAVVDALTAAGVDGGRLGAAGMGMYSPRASNTSEAGRALNRRVELVERPE